MAAYAASMAGALAYQMQGQQQQVAATFDGGFASKMQGQGQQQVALAFDNGCHASGSSELAMFKQLNAGGKDCDAGSQTSTRSGSKNPSDSEESSSTTTLSIQNIPSHYTVSDLQAEVNQAGFWGMYDFFYMPSLGRRIGRKSAILNFASPRVADKFRAMFHRGRLQHSRPQDASLTVVNPPVQSLQGFAACSAVHPAGVVYRDSGMHFVNSKPTVTKPPPGLESLAPQEEQSFGQPVEHRDPCSGPPGSWQVYPTNAPGSSAVSAWGNQQQYHKQAAWAGLSPEAMPMTHFSDGAKATPKYGDDVVYFSL